MELDQPENTECLPLEIVTLPAPKVFPTSMGMLTETDAAAYLALQMSDPKLNKRRLRQWRSLGRGPIFYKPPGTRSLWYRVADLEHWLLVDSARIPGE